MRVVVFEVAFWCFERLWSVCSISHLDSAIEDVASFHSIQVSSKKSPGPLRSGPPYALMPGGSPKKHHFLVDLSGFAPNVCRYVTALSLETALMPGGNPAVAATHFFILLL